MSFAPEGRLLIDTFFSYHDADIDISFPLVTIPISIRGCIDKFDISSIRLDTATDKIHQTYHSFSPFVRSLFAAARSCDCLGVVPFDWKYYLKRFVVKYSSNCVTRGLYVR